MSAPATYVPAVTFPQSDRRFQAAVRDLLRHDATWDLESPQAIATMQSVLRASYPQATVVPREQVLANGKPNRRVLAVYRDNSVRSADPTSVDWDYSILPSDARAAARKATIVDRDRALVRAFAVGMVGNEAQADAITEEALDTYSDSGEADDIATTRASLIAIVRRLATIRPRLRVRDPRDSQDELVALRREPTDTRTPYRTDDGPLTRFAESIRRRL